MNYTHGMLEAFAALIMLVLLIESHFISKATPKRIVLNILLFALFILLVADAVSYLLSPSGKMGLLSEVFFLVSTCFAYNLLAIFHYYLVLNIREKKQISMWLGHLGFAVALAGGLMWVSSFWTGAVYTIVDGDYFRGPFFGVSQVIALSLVSYDCILIVLFFEELGKRDGIAFISYIFSVVVSLMLREMLPPLGIPFVYLAVTLSVIVMYTILHIEQNIELKLKEEKLVRSRVAIMLSQIQPHFLYNALNAIYYLCEKDAGLAQQAIAEFSDYLRGNLDSIGVEDNVPFERELTHIRNYLFLEKLRYEDELEIIYDLETLDFRLPPLTVQPLVENAVRYGVGQAPDGGSVIIRSTEHDAYYQVEVTDDGIGYHADEVQESGRSHIGISNVRERLELMVHGSLEIENREGGGTVARIRIPKMMEVMLN